MFAIAATPGSELPSIIEMPEPRAPGTGEILCRTLEIGICGTDREILLSQAPLVPEGESHLVLGHECLARVEAVGSGVTELAPGNLVVPGVRRAIGRYVQRVDMLPLGTFTERGIMYEHGFSSSLWIDRPEHLHRVDPAIADVAVFTEPLAVVEKGASEALLLSQARLGPGAWQAPRTLVSGQGPIGFAAILACRARGWSVTMLGRDKPDTFRSQLALELGADYRTLASTAAGPGDLETEGFDLVLECTGSDEVMLETARWLRGCGVMVWLGSTRIPEPASLNVQKLMRDSLMLNHLHIGCVNAAPRDFRDALAHLAWMKQMSPAALAKIFTRRTSPADSLPYFTGRESQGIKTVLHYA